MHHCPGASELELVMQVDAAEMHPCIITSSHSCPAIGNQCNYLQLYAIKLLKCFSTFSTIKLLNLNFNCRLVLFMSIVRVGSERVLTDEPVYVLCSAWEVLRRDLSGSCLSHRPILVTIPISTTYCLLYLHISTVFMVAIMNPSIMILLTITSSVSLGRIDSR